MNARIFILLSGLAAACATAQGFINLDFESANLPVIPAGQSGGLVPVADAFPGWQVFYGNALGTPAATVEHNYVSIGAINASMHGPSSSYAIEGNYTALLQSGLSIFSTNAATRGVSIAQSGLVPADSQSLQFKLYGSRNTNFAVFLGGQNLPLFRLSDTPGYSVWGVPTTSFTGQVTELRFSVLSPDDRFYNSFYVDSFEFLPNPVPEPGTWTLLTLGGALFWCANRRRRK